MIINPEARETVLDVGRKQLVMEKERPALTAGALPSLFTDKKPEKQTTAPTTTVLDYDDASILQAVAPLFAGQVRGSMSNGGVTFLQLQGGSLMRPGSRFPARLPQLKGQTFEIEIESISTEAYELRLGQARVRMTYDRSEPGSQRIRLSE